MNKELIVIGAMILMLVFTTSLNHSYAQNATTNASNTVSNATALVNQTLAEVGQNVSAVLNNTSEEVRSTLKELEQNLSNVGSEVGSEILNETEVTGKRVGLGASDVLSNISGEIKEGIIGNSSK
jgi:phage-related protein